MNWDKLIKEPKDDTTDSGIKGGQGRSAKEIEDAATVGVILGTIGIGLLVLWVLVGCQMLQHERSKLRMAVDTYAATMATLADLRVADVLSEEQVETINETYPAVRAGLDEWRAQVAAGEDADQSTRTDVYRGLRILLSIAEEADEQRDSGIGDN